MLGPGLFLTHLPVAYWGQTISERAKLPEPVRDTEHIGVFALNWGA
jgi:hypothetical protein